MTNIQEAEKRIQYNLDSLGSSLDLKNLDLEEIPEKTFQLTHLRKLSLTNNSLININKDILRLYNLEILGLNYNNLQSLPSWIGDFASLKSLDCWNNEIKSIPIELGKLKQLEYLTLGFNKIDTIPKELFIFLSRLKALDIQSNPFKEMPSIREMEIFDLMTYFRNETAYYGFIEVPEELATACLQFLNFFPEYVKRATGNALTLDIIHTKNGLKLTTYETESFDIERINSEIKEYMQSLSPSASEARISDSGSNIESELLNLQLKLQVQHFTSQLEILKFENRHLKTVVDNLVQVQAIMAKNPTPLNLTIQSQIDHDTEELLEQLRELVSGNREAEPLYEDLAVEMRSDSPDKDRIKTLWGELCEKAPKVISFLESISNIFRF